MMRTLRRWWWIPLVLLIGLLLKAALLVPWIAGKGEDAAIGALQAQGLDGVNFVSVDGVDGLGADGLNVTLEGPAADEAAAVEAVQARAEVDNVVYRPIDADEPAEVEVTTSTTEAAPAAAELRPVAITAAATAGGAIVLEGTVADEARRSAIVTSAEAEYGAENVTDNLVIDPDGFAADGGELVLSGEAATAAEQAGWVAQGTAVAEAGSLDLVDQTTVRPVEQTLNDLFELEPIQFDTNRATIRDESIPTLEFAATVINDNPDVGALRVVGHTDSDGSAEANQSLSDARAAAVVAYLVDNGGVDSERLEAEGRGESELLVDPDVTPEDKQQNRRIEWELKS